MSTSTENTPQGQQRRRRRWIFVVAVAAVALITMGMTALLVNILERQTEGEQVAQKVVELTEDSSDPAEWGKNYPNQYESYLATTQMTPTKYHGSTPTEIQMADGTTRTGGYSRIEKDPRLVTMWAGYPFSIDYREARGHAYMLEDQKLTRRVTEAAQPGTCLNCHASTYPIMRELGNGDINAGFVEMNKMDYADAAALAEHPVGCIDCHDPKTMQLRITRPAFIEGIKQAKAAEGVTDYDVNADATPAEMRSFVCGQCHVEYYFTGEDKTLTFPWSKGLKVEQIMEASGDHVDFTHTTTGTKVLKAQHPEFDLWKQGIHAQAGVGCADCHMPYERVGATKVTSHKLQSPLLNINGSCQTCHNTDEADLKKRVEDHQDRFKHTRDMSMDALMDLIHDLEVAQTDGTPAERIEIARTYHRKASFFNDYLYSENSYGFHATAESQRILADAIDAARKGQEALQGKVTEPAYEGGPDQSGEAPQPMPAGQTSQPTSKPLPSLGELVPLRPGEPTPGGKPPVLVPAGQAQEAAPAETPAPTQTATPSAQ